MTKLGKNFTLEQFTRTSTGLPNTPGTEDAREILALVLNVLDPIAAMFGVVPVLSSGHRSKAVNTKVKGAATSQHTDGVEGAAADFVLPGIKTREAFDRIVGSDIPYDQIIFETKDGSIWIHISYGVRHRREALIGTWDNVAKKYVYAVVQKKSPFEFAGNVSDLFEGNAGPGIVIGLILLFLIWVFKGR